MANIEHANIADADLHEPKGVAGATSSTTYHADGAGSGTWKFSEYVLTTVIDDVSAAQSSWVVAPYAGTIEQIYAVIDTAVTVASATLTAELGGTLVTDSSITITTGLAVGDVVSSTPSAANAVSAGQAIEVITDGGSTTASKGTVTLVIQRT